MKRKVSMPRMGDKYTNILKQSLENLGIDVILPPKTTSTTIQIGVRNTAEMICFPIKPTLGNLAEALELGANTLLMYDSLGQCRLRHYAKIQEFALREMGYDNFEMYGVNFKNLFPILRELGGSSYPEIMKELKRYYARLEKFDERKTRWSDSKPNIGLIGEIFTCCDESINHGIEKKIKELGAKPVNTVTLSKFIKRAIVKRIPFSGYKTEYDRGADSYLNGELGGHGKENIASTLELTEKGIGGVIHLLPMSCMVETTIEPFVNSICRESKTPLLRIPIDENTAETNLETRLETFIELIKMREGR